jgi:hypothetical protein
LKQVDLESLLRQRIGAVHYFLKDVNWLILTYGTAWIYHRADTGEVVANCHKQPASSFTKSLLTQKKILASFDTFYQELQHFNPGVQIIVTVSPVRHTRDSLELNSVSKSVLRSACHTLQETYANVEYFPAFEIMMDDLRDYRFYKRDRIHPTEEAEDYIWETFLSRYGSEELSSFIKTWSSIDQALQHKAFHPASTSHQKFLRETLKKLEELKGQVDVEKEVGLIKKQLL